MGDFGSGERWSSKPTTDHALRLDVRWLARQGLFAPGAVAWLPLSWTRGGQPDGNITVRYDARRPYELILDYRTRRPAEAEWTDVSERVWLEWAPCHFGGQRVWCRCPGCGSRRAVLYSVHGRFRCVPCNELAYSSTRDESLDRLNRRGEKITDKLGAERVWVLLWIIPPFKPKHMHWETYERLCREWRAIRDAANGVHAADFSRLIARTDRLLAEYAQES
jgi:hypothetical protein